MTLRPALAVLAALALWAGPVPVLAHGGGVGADGCHNDRKNGGRHCHGGGASSSAPRRSGRAAAPREAARFMGSAVNFASCAAARAAGVAPLYEGDPGYSFRLDRDRDGVACE